MAKKKAKATAKAGNAARRAAKKIAAQAKKVVRKAAPMKKSAARKPAPKKKAAARKPAAKKAAPPKPKDGRPPNWPGLSPYMTVRDAGESLEFYSKAFGFSVEGTVMRDSSGRVMHAGMRLNDAAIMFAPQGMSNDMQPPAASGATGSLSLYVYVPDIDALATQAQAAGAQMLQAPADQFWGDRIAIFRDPDGYHWTFATNIGEFDASKAPG